MSLSRKLRLKRMFHVVFTKKPQVKIMLIVMNAECNVVTKETQILNVMIDNGDVDFKEIV